MWTNKKANPTAIAKTQTLIIIDDSGASRDANMISDTDNTLIRSPVGT